MPTLTPDQAAAYAAMRSFIGNPSPYPWSYTLRGYAGTGKTFTLTQLISDLIHEGHDVAITAPTHQAVNVIQGMLPVSWAEKATCQTIQSLLSLKVKRQNGQDKLVKASNKNHLERFDVVIVDECSMVNAELFEYIRIAAEETHTKIIFTGDPAQIPPVKADGDSPSFLLPGPFLSVVMRQAMDNPILEYCTAIRQAIECGSTSIPVPSSKHNPDIGQGITIMLGDDFPYFMKDAFVGTDYDENPHRFRVIAWTNEQVNYYNRAIQVLRYPMIGIDPFAEGEIVYIAEPLRPSSLIGEEGSQSEDILENTETKAMVSGFVKRSVHPRYPHISAWQLTITTESNTYETWTLDQQGWNQHRKLLGTLATNIKVADALQKSGQLPKDEQRPTWFQYYQLRDAFSKIRPSYAMTGHKSQGNTFENVFVDAMDILKNPNRKEALQILYVACSRATRNLIINLDRTCPP